MTNPYIHYYQNQVGSGIPGFRGLRNQRGYGFLSSFLTKSIIPLFKSIKSIDPFKIAKNTLESPLADDIAKLGGSATGSLIKSLQKGSGKKYKSKHLRKNLSHRRKPLKSLHKPKPTKKAGKISRGRKQSRKNSSKRSIKQIKRDYLGSI